jgi:DNA-binding transcriptional MocR family regulator
MEKMKSNISTIQSSAYAQTHTNAEVINFGIGQPSPSLLPMELFEKAAKHRFQSSQDIGILQYGAAKGFIGFRRELATFLSGKFIFFFVFFF